MIDLRRVILEGKFKFNPSVSMTEECKDIILNLICVNPKNRLGNYDIDQIKKHPWFMDISWDDILNKKVKGDLKIEVLNAENLNTVVQESHQQPTNLKINGFTWNADENVQNTIGK